MNGHTFKLMTLIGILLFASCKEDDKEKNEDNSPTTEVVKISTSFGDMVLWLYPGTPIHRENFLHLADSGFYDGTEFHRNIPNFVIQGGDPLSKDVDRANDGTGGPGYLLTAEIDSSLFKHKYGAVGAARSSNPEMKSNGSQFYICINPSGSPHLDGSYTVFGEVIKGMDVALAIASQPTNAKDQPIDRIPMTMKVLKLTTKQIKDAYGFDVNI